MGWIGFVGNSCDYFWCHDLHGFDVMLGFHWTRYGQYSKKGLSIYHPKDDVEYGIVFHWEIEKKYKDYDWFSIRLTFLKKGYTEKFGCRKRLYFHYYHLNDPTHKYYEYRTLNFHKKFHTDIDPIISIYESYSIKIGSGPRSRDLVWELFRQIHAWCIENCKSKWFIEDYNDPPNHVVKIWFENETEKFMYKLTK